MVPLNVTNKDSSDISRQEAVAGKVNIDSPRATQIWFKKIQGKATGGGSGRRRVLRIVLPLGCLRRRADEPRVN